MKTILVIPGELMDLNTYIDIERGNKFAAATIKKEETFRIHWECKKQQTPPLPTPVDLEIWWHVKNKRKDPDNIAFAVKFILDGLVSAKVIPGDGFLILKSITHRFFVDPQKPRIEVIV